MRGEGETNTSGSGPQRRLGYASYTPLSLRLYDVGVLGFNNRFAWQCPTDRLLALYQDCVSANHLDIGVGTGYFLDHVRFPVPDPRLALLDLNPSSLGHTSRRLARYRPEVYRADVLAPLAVEMAPFDSVGMNYLLHCLPGPMSSRSAAMANVASLLRPGGVFFGSTILGSGVPHSAIAKMELALWNRLGVFTNRDDSPGDLRALLQAHFSNVSLEVRGCVGLFRARP